MIRNARLDECDFIAHLGSEMHKESIFHKYNYDEAKVSLLLHWLITSDNGIMIVAVDENDIPYGGFMGIVEDHYFGCHKVSSDYALFVKPNRRGALSAYQLITEYIKQAKEKGADQITIANSTGVNPEQVKRLFEGLGFKQNGYTMSIEAK